MKNEYKNLQGKREKKIYKEIQRLKNQKITKNFKKNQLCKEYFFLEKKKQKRSQIIENKTLRQMD